MNKLMQLFAFLLVFLNWEASARIAEISQNFLRGTETFQLLIGGFFEIIDIPLRKCIFEKPKYVKSRQKRVTSVEVLTLKSQ